MVRGGIARKNSRKSASSITTLTLTWGTKRVFKKLKSYPEETDEKTLKKLIDFYIENTEDMKNETN